MPDGCTGVTSTVPGTVWKVTVEPGDRVTAGDTVAIVESMKMEITLASHAAGRVREIRAPAGRTIRAGELVAILEGE